MGDWINIVASLVISLGDGINTLASIVISLGDWTNIVVPIAIRPATKTYVREMTFVTEMYV